MSITKILFTLALSSVMVFNTHFVPISESYGETKSIEAVIDLEPYNDKQIIVNVGFIDVIGQKIKHVNYDITVQHNFVTVLEEKGVHNHDGIGRHITAPLDIKSNSNDAVDVIIVFQGIGLSEPYGEPIGKVFRVIQYPNLSQEDMKSADFTKPLLIVPDDFTVRTGDPNGIRVDYSVKAIDDVDGIVSFRCDPQSGSVFAVGKTTVTCVTGDKAHNTAQEQFTVTVELSENLIPGWVRDVAGFWCSNEIDDEGFIEAIQYLVSNDVIVISNTQRASISEFDSIPEWIKTNACWWKDGLIYDEDFVKGLQYLIRAGIIRLSVF